MSRRDVQMTEIEGRVPCSRDASLRTDQKIRSDTTQVGAEQSWPCSGFVMTCLLCTSRVLLSSILQDGNSKIWLRKEETRSYSYFRRHG